MTKETILAIRLHLFLAEIFTFAIFNFAQMQFRKFHRSGLPMPFQDAFTFFKQS